MDQCTQEKLKEVAAQQFAAQQAEKAAQYNATRGDIGELRGCMTNSADAGRPGLMDRIHRRQQHAQQEARRANQLGELAFLLEKNPEVARILDLIEAVGQ